ncbi:DUF3017 domain-containing protein [Streptomonospora litoralis]|uniref:DUF3017 domain-containing protein n=1 Tax=Streptomonospora litoralis TaxID=2498135 RepID=A0A4P6PZS4_9ACTN|nr:DUF3017 domain-containing protein [Streptomonospora litoralis]QBI52421.1 hypothetical protein EKD16_03050 [Streptomonospora litoralis]
MSQNTVEEAVAAESRRPDDEPEPDSAPGEQEPGVGDEAPGWLSQVPYFLVLSTMSAGIVIVAAAHFKRGPALIAGSLLLAAVFRTVLPPHKIGMLAVRRRWLDVITFTGLAVLLIVLAWVAPQLSQ